MTFDLDIYTSMQNIDINSYFIEELLSAQCTQTHRHDRPIARHGV